MHSPLRHIGSIFWKRRPIQLTFFVTKRCNLQCPFCFYLKTKEKPTGGEGELTLHEIERVASSLGPLLWVAFSGGEIYLRDDLVEISTAFYKRTSPAIMLYPTNGMMPTVIRDTTEEIARRCRDSVVAVKLTIDGLEKRHDAIRNAPGNFQKTMQTYELLAGLLEDYPNFELGVNTVFCSENQDDMDEVIGFVSRLKYVKTHTISLVRGDLSDERYKAVDFEKYRRAIGLLERNLKNAASGIYRFKGARIKAAQDIVQRRLIHQTTVQQKRLVPCYAGRLNLVLRENGDVCPCEILPEQFGNIRDHDYDMARLLSSGNVGRILRSIKNNVCYCTHECYFMTNILFNPRIYPQLAREYSQL